MTPLTPTEEWILLRQRLRAAGLCVDCGVEFSGPHRDQCEECWVYDNLTDSELNRENYRYPE